MSNIYTKINTSNILTQLDDGGALGSRGRRISKVEASLDHRGSSKTARATQKNPVSKKQGK